MTAAQHLCCACVIADKSRRMTSSGADGRSPARSSGGTVKVCLTQVNRTHMKETRLRILRLIPQIRPQPPLNFLYRHILPPGIIGDLIPAEAADMEIAGLGMREIPAGN